MQWVAYSIFLKNKKLFAIAGRDSHSPLGPTHPPQKAGGKKHSAIAQDLVWVIWVMTTQVAKHIWLAGAAPCHKLPRHMHHFETIMLPCWLCSYALEQTVDKS